MSAKPNQLSPTALAKAMLGVMFQKICPVGSFIVCNLKQAARPVRPSRSTEKRIHNHNVWSGDPWKTEKPSEESRGPTCVELNAHSAAEQFGKRMIKSPNITLSNRHRNSIPDDAAGTN